MCHLIKNNVSNLGRATSEKILWLAKKELFFIFNKNFYKQLGGVAMGSPSGPILINSILCYHEKTMVR